MTHALTPCADPRTDISRSSAHGAQRASAAGVRAVPSHVADERRRPGRPFREPSLAPRDARINPPPTQRIQPLPSSIPPPAQQPFRPPPTYAHPPPFPNAPPQPPQQQQQPMPPFPSSLPGRPPQQQGYIGTPPQQQQQHPMAQPAGGYASQPMPQQQPAAVVPPPAAAAPPPAAAPAAAAGGAGNQQQAIQAALSMVSEDQRVRPNLFPSTRALILFFRGQGMLMQVFQLTADQINALPPDQRVGVLQLVSPRR